MLLTSLLFTLLFQIKTNYYGVHELLVTLKCFHLLNRSAVLMNYCQIDVLRKMCKIKSLPEIFSLSLFPFKFFGSIITSSEIVFKLYLTFVYIVLSMKMNYGASELLMTLNF